MPKIHSVSSTRPGYTKCGVRYPAIGLVDGLCARCFPTKNSASTTNLSSKLRITNPTPEVDFDAVERALNLRVEAALKKLNETD